MTFRHPIVLVASLVLVILVLNPTRGATAPPPSLVAEVAALQTAVSAQALQISSLQTAVVSLQTSVVALQSDLNTKASQISSLQTAVVSLQTNVVALQSKLQFVTVSGTDMYISGANLNIQSGSGSTDAAVNGLGNL